MTVRFMDFGFGIWWPLGTLGIYGGFPYHEYFLGVPVTRIYEDYSALRSTLGSPIRITRCGVAGGSGVLLGAI